MQSRIKLNFLALFLICNLCFVACGGGGGSDQGVPDYSGSWNPFVDLVSNSCPRVIPDEFLSFSLLHNVKQSVSEDSLGNRILDVVLEDGSDTYIGTAQLNQNGEGNSFSATGSPHELPGFLKSFTCIETIDFTYDSINLEKDEFGYVFAGYVARHSTIICTKGSDIRTCDVTYTGTAYGSR